MMYAVIDTNVLISSMITHNDQSPTVGVLSSIFNGDIIPIYDNRMIEEYVEVMNRPKFSIPKELIGDVIDGIIAAGLFIQPEGMDVNLPDPKDVPFYTLARYTRFLNSYLVTGNIRHFPEEDFIITPRKAMEILNREWMTVSR